MKNLILLTFSILCFLSCEKETIITPIYEQPEIELTDGHLAVSIVRVSTSPDNTNTNNGYHSNGGCEGESAPLTRVGLFIGNTADAVVTYENADYKIETDNGLAYFKKLEPGTYTIYAENELGQKKEVKDVELGNNRAELEF